MQRSTDGFLTTHTGSLPRPDDLVRMMFAKEEGVPVDAAALGPALRHEPSRGGQLFPHLYGTLPLSAIRWVKPLPLGPDGRHVFPELE